MKAVLFSLALSNLAFSATFNPNNLEIGTGNTISSQVTRGSTGTTSNDLMTSNNLAQNNFYNQPSQVISVPKNMVTSNIVSSSTIKPTQRVTLEEFSDYNSPMTTVNSLQNEKKQLCLSNFPIL